MLNFRDFFDLTFVEGYKDIRLKKLVIVLGKPGSGKSEICRTLTKHGFRNAEIDQYFSAYLKKQGSNLNVGILGNQAQNQLFQMSAGANDRRIYYYLQNGYPIVTEKTGRNLHTIEKLIDDAKNYGYTCYGIYVDIDDKLALSNNASRPRSINQGEVVKTIQQINQNNESGAFKSIFGNNFITITNDNTPNFYTQAEKIAKWVLQGIVENFEPTVSLPANTQVFSNPTITGNTLVYNFGSNFLLAPGQKVAVKVPPEFQKMLLRDVILAHKKGPYGHGEPNMTWEAPKSKWRDYYGAYTRIDLHDSKTGKWNHYVDEYGAGAKFAEHRPGFEEETLHDIVVKYKVYPDYILLTNPGNQRAGTNPLTGEKVDPMDKRSTSQLGYLKLIMFPPVDIFSKSLKFYERIYSTTPGVRFSSYSGYLSEPVYGHMDKKSFYPGALSLGYDKKIKEVDGGLWKTLPLNQYQRVANDISHLVSQFGSVGETEVKLFPLTKDPGPGCKKSGSNLIITFPPEMHGKQLYMVEVMCGDRDIDPTRLDLPKPKSWLRNGYAELAIVADNQTLISGAPVPPQGVIVGGTSQKIIIGPQTTVTLQISADTAYIMGWRIGYM